MRIIGLYIVIALIIVGCSNKNAEYNSKVYLAYSGFENGLSDLSEQLSNDSTTNEMAIAYINAAKKVCDSQQIAFNAIPAPSKAQNFKVSLDAYFKKQMEIFDVRAKLYNDAEPGEAFSELQDSLDMMVEQADTLNAKARAVQLQFAKANGFKIQ